MDLDLPRDPHVGALLHAAAAPGRPQELAGQDVAVARFRSAYRPARRRRRLLVVAAAALAAASVGGTAFAAGTGHLPPTVRHWLTGGGEPPPPSSPVAAPRPPDRPRATAATAPSAPGTSGAVSPSAESAAEACRAWTAFRTDPHARPITGDERRALARLAGATSEPAIDEYCRRLLGGATPAATATESKEPPRPSRTHSSRAK
ncbi:hypothetical protein [Dactylosporangium sp. CA-233914]|uniref:hypothetical protein n=1 Tax=Dactylosporangium sp. CA-233914 TaxID=3239934 RepID=UPI003D8A58F0